MANWSAAFKGAAEGIPTGISLVELMKNLEEIEYKKKKRAKEEGATESLNKFIKGTTVPGSTKTYKPTSPANTLIPGGLSGIMESLQAAKDKIPAVPAMPKFGMPKPNVPEDEQLGTTVVTPEATTFPTESETYAKGLELGAPQTAIENAAGLYKARAGEKNIVDNEEGLLKLNENVSKRIELVNQDIQIPQISEIAKSFQDQLRLIGAEMRTGQTTVQEATKSYLNAEQEYSKLIASMKNALAISGKPRPASPEAPRRNLLAIVEAMKNQPVIKQAQLANANIQKVLDQLNDPNPIGDQAFIALAARAFGEVGNLAEKEQERYKTALSLLDKAKQAISTGVSGTLTDANRKYLIDMMNTLKQTQFKMVDDRIDAYYNGGVKKGWVQPEDKFFFDNYKLEVRSDNKSESITPEEQAELDNLLGGIK